MRVSPIWSWMAGVIVAATPVAPAALFAQPARLSVEVAGGLNIPAGDAALVAGTSAAASIGRVHRIDRRIGLITEVHLAGFSGGPREERVGTTDISVLRWALGAEVSLLSQSSSPWRVNARVAAGISTVATDFIRDPDRPPRFFAKINDDVFVLLGGLQLSRSLGTFGPFVRVQPEIYFVGSSLSQLRALNDEIGDSGALVGVPVQFGLRIGF